MSTSTAGLLFRCSQDFCQHIQRICVCIWFGQQHYVFGPPYGAEHDVMILNVTVESCDGSAEPWGSDRRHPCVSFYELPALPGDLCGEALCKHTLDERPTLDTQHNGLTVCPRAAKLFTNFLTRPGGSPSAQFTSPNAEGPRRSQANYLYKQESFIVLLHVGATFSLPPKVFWILTRANNITSCSTCSW